MSEIQVSTSDLYSGSNSLNSSANEIGEVLSQLGRISASAGDAYEGQLREALDAILAGGNQTGARLQSRAYELGKELTARANAFEAANQAAFQSISNISASLSVQTPNSTISGNLSGLDKKAQSKMAALLSLAGITGITWASLTTSIPKPINWGNWNVGNVGSSLDLLGHEYFSANAYKEIGRIFNQVAGSKRAGFVGRLDKAGRFIQKSKFMEFGVIPIGLGVLSDYLDGDNIPHAVSSETIEFLTGLGISAIPVVGEIYLGYKIGMLIGGAAAGLLDTAGMHDLASSVNGALETLDYPDRFGDWVATEIEEAITDFVNNPPTLPAMSVQQA